MFHLKLKMRTVSISVLIVYLWFLAVPALGEYYLSCQTKGCLCSGTDSGVLYCNFSQSVFRLPMSIVTYIKHVKITGTNFSVDIPDQTYGSSWSGLETFEIYGHGGRQQLNLPYKFTKKLSQVKLLRIRNAGLVSIERYAFSTLKAMVELDLSKNKFLNVNKVKNAFIDYSANKLETLNISGIHSSPTMRPFTGRAFLPMTFLLNLDMSWTKGSVMSNLIQPYLSYLHYTFNIIPNIVTLNISGTESYNIWPKHTNCSFHWPFFNKFKHLEVLRMDYWAANQLVSDSTESALPCSNNAFDFDHGCYRLPARLKELHLNYAFAKKFYIDFEKDVCISSKLEHLSFRNLILSGPIGKITGLHNLKSLDVSNTRIPFNLQLFLDMPSIEEIDASGNNLYKIENETRFPGLLKTNTNLKQISLRDNGFFELPSNLFSENKLLESIDISQNRLQYLKLNLTACVHLHQLSVADNRLKMIDSLVTNHLDFLVTGINHNKVSITIDLNGLTCSCEGALTTAWVEKTNVTVIANEKENLTCDTGKRQEYMNNYSSTALNCSNENKTLDIDISIPGTRSELWYLIGGISGCGLCALCFFITVFLLRKYGNRRLPESQENFLKARIVENDEQPEFASYGEEQSNISNDTELHNTSEDKGPQNKMSGKDSRDMSAYFLNANEPRSNGSELYRREISVSDSIRLLDSLEPQNNVSVVYHTQLPVSACLSHDRNKRDNGSETHKKKHVSVPDSIYFIGLSETLFESNNRTPHFVAFLAYSHHDKDFVVSKLYRVLQRQLEKYIPSWNQELLTVLYDKNFLPGQCTMDLIRAAVFSSYVTIAIVSDSFIKSPWCHYEMEAAIEAKVPIISVYLPSSDTDKFPAILKYIYHNHVRIFWPDTDDNILKLSDEEAGIIRDLAFSISTYVKQPAP